ncbi:helix-turn-helix domain-containing protein [Candidatus Magnetaquicoccus inordinatus]|uniref:helix-turn-helix domain-containing protein n=1 Tax=Candidatus Magnetaquicoccus inordinatus TaxID=2496818 RepID=UPI00102D28BF|nr:helix-turn-helix domain-containing protein [Candidatus Magnetaquicoccus inordinatus]
MGKPSNLTPEQRTQIVLALLRREEPASILARRYGVSTKTIGQWQDDFIAAGTSGLAAGKRQTVDNAKQLAASAAAASEPRYGYADCSVPGKHALASTRSAG